MRNYYATIRSRIKNPAVLSATCLLIVLSGTFLVQAAVSFVGLEAETSTLSGQSSVGSDASASGGSYVGFNGGSSGVFSFLETFDGSPTTPQPWSKVDWDVV